jgi:hypothetical protein
VGWMRGKGAVGRLGVVVLAVAVLAAAARPGRRTASPPGRRGSATPSSRWPATAATTSPTTRSASLRSRDPATWTARRPSAPSPPRPVAVRPGPARLRHLAAVGQRAGGVVHPARAGAGDHAGQGLPAGRPFTVVVRYAGVPAVVTDPDESIEGWVPTDDGAFVVGSRRGRRGGIRSTTTRRTRRPTPSGSPSPGASR